MKMRIFQPVLSLAFILLSAASHPAFGVEPLGTGQASVLGGDLTDPEDDVVDKPDWGAGKPEAEMRPEKGNWVEMKMQPVPPPGAPPHQIHAYQSWQNTPAVSVFMNKIGGFKKWYIGFKDGGRSGPTMEQPYSLAVSFEKAYVMTHFTLTSSPEEVGRDPKHWAIQGSNTGEDDDWTDIYVCEAKDRATTPIQENPRSATSLFTSFDSASMEKSVTPADLKKLQDKLKDKKIEKADFTRPANAYHWFRIVIYSCFNPNSNTYADFNHPPGFALGQLEFYGVPGVAKKVAPKPRPVVEQLKPAAYDPAFIIGYWVGPSMAETTLERYKEIADCGFNVAFPALDQLWAKGSKESDEYNKKYLDLCQQVGIKGLVWDGYLPNGGDKGVWPKPTPEEIPEIEKALDGLIAKYSAHPGFMGLLLGDEFQIPQHARLGLVTQYLLKKDPKHLPYYNNLPNYAFKSNTQYEEFVADYLKTVQPALFSWDAYKQMMGAGDENFYWHNLQIVQDQCAKAKIPFNQIIVSLKHMGYRECSEADLRWQVYTSLAYGSKGIQYFTYWSVKGLASGDSSALMTMDGKRDVKWEHVKKINHAIAKLGPTLVKLTPTGTYGTSPLMPGMKKLPNFAPVKKAEGGALLIGCFEDASRRQYTMVVNRSFTAKVTAKLTLDSRITSTAEISQETGKPLDAKPSAGKPLEVELLPGEGRLFVLPENGLTFNPPDEIFGGKDFAMANIGFDPKGENAKVTGKFFWRAKGETKFASLPIAAAAEKGQYQAAVPAAATKAPFEYYIEMQEDGQKPVTEPDAGAQGPSLATPDVTPPTAVAELASPIVKSYRVALSWKLATDDRAVAEYRVYRGAADTFPLDEKALLTKLPATAGEFTDSAPPVKQTAFYAVQATDVVGRNGEVRYLRVDVPGSQPPANTLKVVATPGSKSVALAWSGELEPSVTAFEIHRAAGKDGAFQKIADITDIKTAKYLDKDSAFGSEYRYAVRPRNNAAQLGELGQVATASPLRYLKRINCGGLEIAAEDGVPWEADKKPGHATMASPSSSIWTIPAAVVGPGVVKDVYQSERWSNGQIHYTFGVDPGRYEVVLHFAETNRNFASKGKRVFDILINEEKAVEKVDIFTNAGAINTAWQFRKEVDVKERELTISLAANPTGPAIKGIEVRGLTGK